MLVVSFRSLDDALDHRVAIRTALGFAALGDLAGRVTPERRSRSAALFVGGMLGSSRKRSRLPHDGASGALAQSLVNGALQGG
jgi:hypothetical protein